MIFPCSSLGSARRSTHLPSAPHAAASSDRWRVRHESEPARRTLGELTFTLKISKNKHIKHAHDHVLKRVLLLFQFRGRELNIMIFRVYLERTLNDDVRQKNGKSIEHIVHIAMISSKKWNIASKRDTVFPYKMETLETNRRRFGECKAHAYS